MGTAVGAEESLDESVKGLTWSLRSIWIWMRIIGIELEQSKIYSPLCRRLSLAIGFGLLLLATWFQEQLQTFVTRQDCCLYFVLSRLYTVLLCLG